MRKEPHPARRLLKTILMYRVMSTTYRLQAMYHGLRVKYWTERMFLQYYSSPVVNGLGSLARQERLLLQATKNMLLPWAKSYPSHRRRWLSATLRERAYSESDPGESTQP